MLSAPRKPLHGARCRFRSSHAASADGRAQRAQLPYVVELATKDARAQVAARATHSAQLPMHPPSSAQRTTEIAVHCALLCVLQVAALVRAGRAAAAAALEIARVEQESRGLRERAAALAREQLHRRSLRSLVVLVAYAGGLLLVLDLQGVLPD